MALVLILAWALVWAFIGREVGERRGDRALGVMMGLLLGPFGLLFLAVLAPATVTCPHCGSALREGQAFCPSCGHARPRPRQWAPKPLAELRLRRFPSRREVVCPQCGAILRAVCGLPRMKVRCPCCGETFPPIPTLSKPKDRSHD